MQNNFSKSSAYNISPMSSLVENFYMTDPISKASSTMAKCTELLVGDDKLFIFSKINVYSYNHNIKLIY